MPKTTILLADDHALVRQGLKALLMAEPDFEVVAEAETGRQAVQLAKKFLPEVVVMDIAMPLLNGFEATRQIVHELPSVRIIILSSYSDDEYVEQLIDAGAIGYLLKQTAANEVIKAIREARQGNAYFSPFVSRRMLEHYRRAFVNGQPVQKCSDALTSREREVIQLIAEGNTNKQIAGVLCISVKTVEKHRQQVMNRLNIHDIAGLTRYAMAKGMIETKAPLLKLA
jgi:DNA-binding NarL/FixJ family response regulator